MRNALAIKKGDDMDDNQYQNVSIDKMDEVQKRKSVNFFLVANNAWSAFKAIKHLDIEILHNSSKLHFKEQINAFMNVYFLSYF